MASKVTVEQVESLLVNAFRTVMRVSRETVTVERVFDPEADLEAQGENYSAMDEEDAEAESQVPTTDDPTTIQGLRAVVLKVFNKTMKEVRQTASVEINSSPKKRNERELQAVTTCLNAAAYKKLKTVVLVSHFLKKQLGVGNENYNKIKSMFQRKLKTRKIELHRINKTKGYSRKAHGSQVVVYTIDDLPMMHDVLLEVNSDMMNV